MRKHSEINRKRWGGRNVSKGSLTLSAVAVVCREANVRQEDGEVRRRTTVRATATEDDVGLSRAAREIPQIGQ
ncbi:hypothetical protein MRX96_022004 [Rhipicephalus microplus]